MKLKKQRSVTDCPCGGKAFATCCAPLLSGAQQAVSAEQLMRSRYTAYTLADDAYLRASWAAKTRPAPSTISEAGVQWLGLDVRRHGEEGNEASVEFVARYKIDGRAYRLHEISRFVREDGCWYYLDGSFPEQIAPKSIAARLKEDV